MISWQYAFDFDGRFCRITRAPGLFAWSVFRFIVVIGKVDILPFSDWRKGLYLMWFDSRLKMPIRNEDWGQFSRPLPKIYC